MFPIHSKARAQINAITLAAPALEYGNGAIIQPSSGQWNLRDLQFKDGAKVPSVGCLSLAREHHLREDDVYRFLDDLFRMARRMGMQMPEQVRCQEGCVVVASKLGSTSD